MGFYTVAREKVNFYFFFPILKTIVAIYYFWLYFLPTHRFFLNFSNFLSPFALLVIILYINYSAVLCRIYNLYIINYLFYMVFFQ